MLTESRPINDGPAAEKNAQNRGIASPAIGRAHWHSASSALAGAHLRLDVRPAAQPAVPYYLGLAALRWRRAVDGARESSRPALVLAMFSRSSCWFMVHAISWLEGTRGFRTLPELWLVDPGRPRPVGLLPRLFVYTTGRCSPGAMAGCRTSTAISPLTLRPSFPTSSWWSPGATLRAPADDDRPELARAVRVAWR